MADRYNIDLYEKSDFTRSAFPSKTIPYIYFFSANYISTSGLTRIKKYKL
jgi:hypothetical protein